MILKASFIISLLTCFSLLLISANIYDDILSEQNERLRIELNKLIVARWAFLTNLTEYNGLVKSKTEHEYEKFKKEQYERIKPYLTEDERKKMTDSQWRQFQKLGDAGSFKLDYKYNQELTRIQIKIEKIFEAAQNEKYKNHSHEQDLKTMKNEKLLREKWVKFRDATGKKIRNDIIFRYKMLHKTSHYLIDGFEEFDYNEINERRSGDFMQQIENLMNDLMDFYKKIHAYVRFHLKKIYKDTLLEDGTIPEHLWVEMLTSDKIKLNPDIPSLNKIIDKRLQNYTIRQMVEISEDFFVSLGMKNMTNTFWEKSIFEKPKDVDMVCHESAHDFREVGDFRIKFCIDKDLSNLIVIHHEMGHIQYYMNYETQPTVFRDGANPGFHEAIGDLIAMSFLTPQHLVKIGLVNMSEIEQNIEAMNLNHQLKMALDNVIYLLYPFVMDKWRWDVYRNPKLESHLNRHWWDLMIKFRGLSPPVKRSEQDFDPGAEYYIAKDIPTVQYVVSVILQFQFYKHLCQHVSGWEKLHECDFYGNKRAGSELIAMLAKGSSDKWQNILNDFIGTPNMSLDALFEYFEPLNKTLSQFIEKHNITVGWNATVHDYFIDSQSSLLETTLTMFFTFARLMVTYLTSFLLQLRG